MFGQTFAALLQRAARVKPSFCNGGLRLMLMLMPGLLVWLATVPLAAQTANSSANENGPHYSIVVHTSGVKRNRESKAIVEFVKHRVREINAKGGLLGRRLKVRFYDDDDDKSLTIANTRAALADPRLLAMVGIWSSSRGSHVVESIGNANVPFVSEMSVDLLFAHHPNIYTLAHSVRSEASVFLALAKENGIERVAYAGLANDSFAESYLGHLVDTSEGPGIVSSFWETEETTIADYDRAIDRFVAARPQLILLALGSSNGARFLARMKERKIRLPVFISYGSISKVLKYDGGASGYAGNMYELSTGGVANLNNERIERLARELGVRIDGGDKNEASYTARDLGYGARYADVVQLIVDAAAGKLERYAPNAQRGGQLDDDIASVRERIAAALSKLREGRRYWKGRAQYWTFDTDRATSERGMLLWRTPGQNEPVLHPTQFIRVDGKMYNVPVLYLHLDMIRMFEVETNERRFDAEFYLTLRSHKDLSIEAIDFTNAFRSNTARQPIKWRQVAKYHDDVDEGLGPRRIYHVTGRFAFEPDLAKYPFDEQLVTISFQPADASSVFILQPPGGALRQKSFRVEDWKLISHYVGTTDRIITSVRGRSLEEHVVPYYNFNYTWVMRREVIDYLVRVVVPLVFILIVAYLAAFIPRREFNATIAIQVTALLSAIALYFTLAQPNSDEITLSDKIFVSSYAIVSLMIALSIFEVRESEDEGRLERGTKLTTLRAGQIYVIPVLAFAVIGWLIASAATDRSIAEGIRELVRWGLLSFSDIAKR
jgi:ABC-type branched-subunit amino acid transport system substrate-binding protein